MPNLLERTEGKINLVGAEVVFGEEIPFYSVPIPTHNLSYKTGKVLDTGGGHLHMLRRRIIGFKNPDFINCNGEKICIFIVTVSFYHD